MDATAILSAAVPYLPHALAVAGWLLAIGWRISLGQALVDEQQQAAAQSQADAATWQARHAALQQALCAVQDELARCAYEHLQDREQWRQHAPDPAPAQKRPLARSSHDAEPSAAQARTLAAAQQETQYATARIAQLEATLHEQAAQLQATQERLTNALAMADRLKRQKARWKESGGSASEIQAAEAHDLTKERGPEQQHAQHWSPPRSSQADPERPFTRKQSESEP
ncbi:MAG: hypothetical protein ACOYB3_09700 [Azonexus sp.]